MTNLNVLFIPIISLLCLLIIIITIIVIIQSIQAKGEIIHSLNMKLFSVRVPKGEADSEKGNKQEKEIIGIAEQFYVGLSNIKTSFWKRMIYGAPNIALEIALPEIGEEIHFFISVSRKWAPIIEKHIHSVYAQAEIDEIKEDYNIFNVAGVVTGSRMQLMKNYVFPIRTYKNLEVDPLNGITTALSKLESKGEGAAIQIVIVPDKSGWQKRARKIAKEMQQGKNYDKAFDAASTSAASRGTSYVWGAIMGKNETNKSLEEKNSEKKDLEQKMTPLQEETVKALESKSSKASFKVNIRLVASAATELRAQQILEHLESSFVQFADLNFNGLKPKRLKGKNLRNFIYDFSLRNFKSKHSFILNTEELASIYHFPNNLLSTPKVKFVKTKSAEPPVNMPSIGVSLGTNTYRGVETNVVLSSDDRRRHLYIIGQTGTGKSFFMKSLAAQDIDAGRGLCVIDPHGDLISDILTKVPKEKADDVIIFNPADLDRPIGLNMLEYDPKYPEQKTFVVNELINIFNQLYDLKQTGGPMFEQYTRNALMLLMDDPNEKFTLMEVPKVLADAIFRKRLLDKCQNITVKDFWEKEAEKAGGEAALQNIVPYITSKFNIFTTNDYMQPIIGQAESGLKFREIIDQGKILLVNLSKGRLGDTNSALIGLIIVGKLLMASLSRVDMPEDQRKDFYLYIDEFQNVSTDSIATILSEARKYRLNLVVAHQFIAQLKDNIRNAVFGNVGSMACFRVGAEDAKFLEEYYKPVYLQQDLINIDNANAYVRLMMNGQASRPFNIKTGMFNKGSDKIVNDIIELSKLKYGRDRSLMMQEIINRQK